MNSSIERTQKACAVFDGKLPTLFAEPAVAFKEMTVCLSLMLPLLDFMEDCSAEAACCVTVVLEEEEEAAPR